MPKPEPMADCPLCGGKMGPLEMIPLALWSKEGVYAVNALRHQACLSNCEESGGSFEFWWKAGGLSDVMERIPERPLYVSQDDDGNWYQVENPEEQGDDSP